MEDPLLDGLRFPETDIQVELLKRNVYELQEQLTAANKRIADLVEQVRKLNKKDWPTPFDSEGLIC